MHTPLPTTRARSRQPVRTRIQASGGVAGKQTPVPAHAPSEADAARVCYLDPSGGLAGASAPTWTKRNRRKGPRNIALVSCPALESVALALPGNAGVGALFWVTSVSRQASFVGTGFREGPTECGFKGCLQVGKANEQCSEAQGQERTEIEDIE